MGRSTSIVDCGSSSSCGATASSCGATASTSSCGAFKHDSCSISFNEPNAESGSGSCGSNSKKWPSRQPVNCQYCGVRISMAFNLRNHVRRCKFKPCQNSAFSASFSGVSSRSFSNTSVSISCVNSNPETSVNSKLVSESVTNITNPNPSQTCSNANYSICSDSRTNNISSKNSTLSIYTTSI